MSATILITRPDPAGAAFADAVRARLSAEVPLVLSPLMRIEDVTTCLALDHVKCLIFTSAHAVRAFARLNNRRDLPCYTVGDATARVARDIGLRATSCHGDAKALVARMIADAVTGPCLYLRGEHTTGDITENLYSAGIETDQTIIYQQLEQQMSQAAHRLMQQRHPVVVPLFSPRSARLFFQAWVGPAPVLIAAISEKVAACCPNDTIVKVADRPDADAILDLLPDLLAQANQLEGRNRAQ